MNRICCKLVKAVNGARGWKDQLWGLGSQNKVTTLKLHLEAWRRQHSRPLRFSRFIIIIIIIIPRQCLWCCHHGRAIARVHPVHLMNVERRQAAADSRPRQSGRRLRLYRLPESTTTIAIYYYYSAGKLILILPSHGGRKLSRPSWLVTYRDGLPALRGSPIPVLTGSDVAQLRWSRPTRYY